MHSIKSFAIIIALCVLCGACHRGYTLHGTITEGKDVEGKEVTLLELRGLNSPEVIQKTTVQDGQFTFKGKVSYPDMHLIYINGNGPVHLFLENANLSVTVSMDSLDHPVVTGSASHMEYEQMFRLLAPYDQKMSDISDEADGLDARIDSLQKPASLSADAWKAHTDSLKKALNDSLAVALRETALNGKLFIYDWIAQHADSYVAAFIAYEMLKKTSQPEEVSQVIASLDKEQIAESQWLHLLMTLQRYLTRTIEGSSYTDFELPLWEGGKASLSNYLKNSTFVMLYFWAAWNPQSRKGQKDLVPVYRRFHPKGLEIVSVSLDRKFEDWDLALKDDSIPWPQLSDQKFWQTEAVELYNVNEIPQFFIINNEGSIIFRGKTVTDIEGMFEKIMPDKPETSSESNP